MRQTRIYVISGAGLSAESNLSTFRSADGIWANADLNKVCNFSTWKNHREEIFQFYGSMMSQYLAAKPNSAHRTLAYWQKHWGPDRVRLITQNVDDLLEQAGATDVTHLHGEVGKLHCTACGTIFPITHEQFHSQTRCPKCDSLKGVKPHIVFFHEKAPNYRLLQKMHTECIPDDFIIYVGSSMNVIPVEMVIPLKRMGSDRNIQINLENLNHDWFGKNIESTASDALASIDPMLTQAMDS